MFRTSITDVVASWEQYRAGKTTNKNHPMHKLVVDEIPEVLESWTPNSSSYKFVGSDGQGNILRTPWFATLNLEVTDSATKGYYLVYLISSDLKTLVLEIGFGANQFEKQYGRGKKFSEALSIAVVNMRLNSEHLISKSLHATKNRTNLSTVVLDDSGDYHLGDYGKCAIYSLTYEIGDLPTEADLKRDYLEYLNLYDKMSESLLLADVDSYVYESVDEKEIESEVSVITFVPRVFKKRESGSSPSSSGNSYRYSKKSDKVGKLGEKIVFEHEKKRLSGIGRTDLADKVIWHRDFPADRTPGWDITSFDADGQELLIEVKASEGSKISDVEVTINEWVQAERNSSNSRYRIYLVTNVFTKPVIEVVENPAKMVDEGSLTLKVVRYQLSLGARID
jgi:hypothetical protein